MVEAAAILVYRENGRSGVVALLKRSFDFKRVRATIWYVPIILLMPGIMVLSYVAMRLMGVVLPIPQFSFATTLMLLAVCFIAAIGEELGWLGYAIDPFTQVALSMRLCGHGSPTCRIPTLSGLFRIGHADYPRYPTQVPHCYTHM